MGDQAPGDGHVDALDDSRITRFQWKIMFVSGMGFFTDAYDLFVIGIVVALLKMGAFAGARSRGVTAWKSCRPRRTPRLSRP